ncbi:MAG: adventurous gliding motility protein CglF [Myxococcales bacterium]|nr:adventurous gliding motility protein CglF [Myxococcales bacterium]MCB9649676.1 adventurous gliding motility protein CglF [Deltaproteobacteria bacterium]
MSRRRETILGLFVVAGLLLAAPAAFAQDSDDPGVIYKKKTVLSFEDDTIDGDLTRPDHGFIESRKRVRHSNLIKIREDFRDKILGSFVNI